jgi:hypothetical protein
MNADFDGVVSVSPAVWKAKPANINAPSNAPARSAPASILRHSLPCSAASTRAASENRNARNTNTEESASAPFTITNVAPQPTEQSASIKSAWSFRDMRVAEPRGGPPSLAGLDLIRLDAGNSEERQQNAPQAEFTAGGIEPFACGMSVCGLAACADGDGVHARRERNIRVG